MKKKYIPLLLFVSIATAAFSQSKIDSTKGLKDYYQSYFSMGVAVSPQLLKSADAKLILQQFNSITPENAMKPGPIHPAEDKYNWAPADEIVDYAQANHLKVRGHTF